jgi:hypothetical protein
MPFYLQSNPIYYKKNQAAIQKLTKKRKINKIHADLPMVMVIGT